MNDMHHESVGSSVPVPAIVARVVGVVVLAAGAASYLFLAGADSGR